MKHFLVFLFETGDSSCPYWQELAVVESEAFDIGALADSFDSYMENLGSEDRDYEELVADVLEASGWLWFKVVKHVPECDDLHVVWV